MEWINNEFHLKIHLLQMFLIFNEIIQFKFIFKFKSQINVYLIFIWLFLVMSWIIFLKFLFDFVIKEKNKKLLWKDFLKWNFYVSLFFLSFSFLTGDSEKLFNFLK
jgi:hypothetical protein